MIHHLLHYQTLAAAALRPVPIPPPQLGGHISNSNFAHLKGRSKTGLAVGGIVRLKYVDELPGSKEKMRNKMLEAQVANYTASSAESGTIKGLQIHLKVLV